MGLHILWINEAANFTGGCERYIADTATLLKEWHGTTNTLMYGIEDKTDVHFLKVFDHAFPKVDIERQISQIEPDIVYVHRLTGLRQLASVLAGKRPALRFYHDHKLFCLREHKYTTLGKQTCARPVGPYCYACLGFVNRANTPLKVRLRTVGSFKKEIRLNHQLAGAVVGSDYMAGHLEAHGFNSGKLHVDPLYTLQQPKTPRGENEFPGDAGHVLFVGQLVRGKGVDTLIEALPRTNFPNRVAIVGSGRQEEEFKQLAESLGVAGRIDWPGRLTPDELEAYYRDAVCCVVPSRTPETFCLTGLEAFSHGVPVIGTRVGGIGQWLEDGRNGLSVEPNDSAALADALARLLNDSEYANRLGAQGQQDLSDKFSPQHHVDRLHEIFESHCR